MYSLKVPENPANMTENGKFQKGYAGRVFKGKGRIQQMHNVTAQRK